MKFFAVIGLLLGWSVQAHAIENVITPPMVVIPAGEFLMGDDAEGKDTHHLGEFPQHKVKINAFKFSKYELTVKQFRQFVDDTGYKIKKRAVNIGVFYYFKEATDEACWQLIRGGHGIDMLPGTWNSSAFTATEFHPAACLTFADIEAYTQWLSQHTGKKYRLPSEAEWEYAARAGVTMSNIKPEDVCGYGNVYDKTGKARIMLDYGMNIGDVHCDDGAEYATVVGMYKPNGFGLYDMTGNMREYVADYEHKNYNGAPQDGTPWLEHTTLHKIFKYLSNIDPVITRGSAFIEPGLGITTRGQGSNDNPSSWDGFRLVEVIADGEKDACGNELKLALHCDKTEPLSAFEIELAASQQAQREKYHNL